MQGCLTIFIIDISCLICSTILCLRMVLFAMTLIATPSPVSEFCANLTLAKVPSPMVLPSSYFPNFFFTLCISQCSFQNQLSKIIEARTLPKERRFHRRVTG
nr:hypothetical protein Iba_chr02fCG13530 [Ipomoea batatas]